MIQLHWVGLTALLGLFPNSIALAVRPDSDRHSGDAYHN
jgi:hypothetical protein